MIKEKLISGCAELGVEINPEQVEKFIAYMGLLIEWNEKINLTAITDPEEIVVKHFLDSLLLLPYIDKEGSLADVGTGAGFPGIPLKIMLPELKVSLIDSLAKRTKFLQIVIDTLGLKEIHAFHGRAEDVGRNKAFRGSYDIVVARAVSRLNVLTEYCLPLAKIGGKFIAAKGPSVVDEVNEAEYANKMLGGKQVAIHHTALPFLGDHRSIVVIQKVSKTPDIYPRKAGLPEKKPLFKA